MRITQLLETLIELELAQEVGPADWHGDQSIEAIAFCVPVDDDEKGLGIVVHPDGTDAYVHDWHGSGKIGDLPMAMDLIDGLMPPNRPWYYQDDDSYADDYGEVIARTLDEAKELIRTECEGWGDEGTHWDITIFDDQKNEVDSIHHYIYPSPPDCTGPDGTAHDGECEWAAPHNLVGGLKDNPGVASTGGLGMAETEVCKKCGVFRTEERGNNLYGAINVERRITSVSYSDATEESLAWAAEQQGWVLAAFSDLSFYAYDLPEDVDDVDIDDTDVYIHMDDGEMKHHDLVEWFDLTKLPGGELGGLVGLPLDKVQDLLDAALKNQRHDGDLTITCDPVI